MSYATIKDILQYSAHLHQHASNLYEQLREQTQRERVDMMLVLLSRHEQTLAASLQSVQEHANESVLQEWHQFEASSIADVLDNGQNLHPDMSVDELVQIALKIDDYLIQLYRQILSEASGKDSQALFQGLISLEENEKMSTVRAALSANDW
ncbi:MAG: hypothetical protein IBX52_12665 [Bacterioplanes sp.]|nr:hypothetical protein [Bacterioplanes sp.]